MFRVRTLQAAGSEATNIPCYTSVREPMDRLVSLYYYMMDKWRRPVTKLLQEMSAQEAITALEGLWPLMRQTPLLSHFGACASTVYVDVDAFGEKYPQLRIAPAQGCNVVAVYVLLTSHTHLCVVREPFQGTSATFPSTLAGTAASGGPSQRS